MAIGGWNALAEGFRGGFALGNEAMETRARKQALQMKMAEERATQIQALVKQSLEYANSIGESTAQRTPEYEQGLAAMKAQIDDSISTLGSVPLVSAQETARNLGQMVNVVWPSVTLTASERNMRKIQSEVEGKMGFARSLMGGSQPMPAPQQAGPAPTSAPGEQELPWLQQAAAAAPQEQQPAVQTAQAVQQQPSMSGMDPIRQRMLESVFPPTEQEKAVQKVKMDRFAKYGEAADAAHGAIIGMQRAQQLLDEGIITGAGADWRKLAAKYSGIYYTPEQIRRTEEFESIMNEQVLPRIKALGSSTAVSDTDRQFTSKIVGADISLSEGGLRDILKRGLDGSINIMNKYNKEADTIAPEMRIELPQFAPAAEEGQPGMSTMEPDAEGWINLGPGVRMRAIQ